MMRIEERMLECAKALKGYCAGFEGECTDCLFNTKNDECAFSSYLPVDWEIGDLLKKQSVELLKEMRDNISGLDGDEAKNKIIALTMAIEALEG